MEGGPRDIQSRVLSKHHVRKSRVQICRRLTGVSDWLEESPRLVDPGGWLGGQQESQPVKSRTVDQRPRLGARGDRQLAWSATGAQEDPGSNQRKCERGDIGSA